MYRRTHWYLFRFFFKHINSHVVRIIFASLAEIRDDDTGCIIFEEAILNRPLGGY